jgi:hypothetical protein
VFLAGWVSGELVPTSYLKKRKVRYPLDDAGVRLMNMLHVYKYSE